METKPWHQFYPEGVPTSIDPDRYPSIVAMIEESFSKFADKPAFECMGKAITFRELDALSKAFAAYLQNHTSLQPGDRVAIQLPNILQYPVVMFGVLRAGMIVVNTNPLYTAREMQHQFKDSGAKALIILSNFASKLEEIQANTPIETVLITSFGDMLGFPKGTIVNAVLKYVKKMVPAYNLPEAIPFSQALSQGKAANFSPVEINNQDIAFLQYTGGTTGVSKGAMLTHRNIIANLEQNFVWMGIKLKEGMETVITPLPLYHIFSLTVNCLSMIKIGAKNILIPNPRDIKGFIKELGKHQFSVITGVNTLYNGLLNHPDFASLDFSYLKVAVGGGMAVQQAVAKKWKEVTKKPLLEGYGLTETAPVLSCNPLDGNDKIGTIGLPFPSTDMKIMDDDGNEVPLGERGEIVANGPQVMLGYWNRQAETDKVFFPGGWFRTGDIGVMEASGFTRIVDRKKDMILVSGFNVFPNEVEDVVAEHPKVLEVAAVGVADAKSTEAVKLFVVKKDESLTAEELIEFCRKNLTGYKVPKHVEFRTELPKTNVGKILRRMLKDEANKTV